MRIGVVHQHVAAEAAPDVADVLVQVGAVAAALGGLGHEVSTYAATLDLTQLDAFLTRERPDVVFNLVEELGGSARLSPLVPAFLSGRQVPYTGSPFRGLALADDKLSAKRQMLAHGLPTPAWLYGRGGWCPRAPHGRAIIKAVFEHASYELEVESVVSANEPVVHAALASRRARGGVWFAEEYVHGRELNVALLQTAAGLRCLEPAEIDFSAFRDGEPHIVGYRAKWRPDSAEYEATPRRCCSRAGDRELLEQVKSLAARAFTSFGLAGYARVDFRVDEGGTPWILEVNANPCLSPDAGYQAALREAGIDFSDAVGHIVQAAMSRAEEPDRSPIDCESVSLSGGPPAVSRARPEALQ